MVTPAFYRRCAGRAGRVGQLWVCRLGGPRAHGWRLPAVEEAEARVRQPWPPPPCAPHGSRPRTHAALPPPRLAEALLEEAVAHYIAALLCGLRAVTEAEVAGLRRDAAALRAFFEKHTKADKVGRGGVGWGRGGRRPSFMRALVLQERRAGGGGGGGGSSGSGGSSPLLTPADPHAPAPAATRPPRRRPARCSRWRTPPSSWWPTAWRPLCSATRRCSRGRQVRGVVGARAAWRPAAHARFAMRLGRPCTRAHGECPTAAAAACPWSPLPPAAGVSPTLLAGLVNARAASDRAMTKADAREVRAPGGGGGGWAVGGGSQGS